MNKTVIIVLVFGTASLPAAAQTTDDVMLCRSISTTIRYSAHENAADNSNLQMMDGVLADSRQSLHGTEDLDGGTEAMFILEPGLFSDTDGGQQGGRLFGRTAVVGLEGDYGKLYLGW